MLLGIGKSQGYGWDVLKGYQMWQQRQTEPSSAVCLLIPKGDDVGVEIATRWNASYVEKPLSVSILMGACRHLMSLKVASASPASDPWCSLHDEAGVPTASRNMQEETSSRTSWSPIMSETPQSFECMNEEEHRAMEASLRPTTDIVEVRGGVKCDAESGGDIMKREGSREHLILCS